MIEPKSEIYEFEGFRMDVSEHRLTRDGEETGITPKAFDLLTLLVRNHGHLLTKDRIIEELWAGSFVEEANLNVNISAVRKILGDTATEQKFIETVPRQGYRFVADVSRHYDLHPPPQAETGEYFSTAVVARDQASARNIADQIIGEIRNAKRRRNLVLGGGLIAGVVLIVGAWFAYSSFGTGESRPKSIAVLPFRSLAQSSSDEALEMGMTDALITKLGKVDQLTVRPTSAVRKFATQYSDALDAGRELRVEAVLDGKVQRDGNKVRVSVQLIRIADGTTLWSESFDDFFTNIFAVQDSISDRMVQSLALKLSPKEQESIEKRYTEDTEAYQLFLQAQFHHLQISEEGSRNAIKYYEQAVAKDPRYALAWASMVGAYAHIVNLNDDRQGNLQKARNAAIKSIEIDPELAEAHEALATVTDFFDWNWEAAEKEYKRAIELGPNREGPHYAYSIFLSRFKRHDEAVKEIRIASQINPTALYVQNQVVLTLYRARRYDEALLEAKRSLEIKPDDMITNGFIFRIYTQTGKPAEAEATAERMIKAGASGPEMLRARVHLNYGRRAEAEKILRPIIANYKEGDTAWLIALDHVRLGELDPAFEFLEKAFQRREAQMTVINIEPEWDPIRGDRRYSELMNKMRLPL